MIRAHLRRSIGGGLGGPLRSLPQESVARAKPALEPEHGRPCDSESVLHRPRESGPLPSAGFAGATNPGGRLRKGGEAPLRGSLAPSAARSTYREYASRAAVGRRLAAGPFSSLWPERFSDRTLGDATLREPARILI